MDRPQPVSSKLENDLRNIRQLNRFFGSHRLIVHFLRRWIKPGDHVRIVDLATGSGDIPRLIVDRTRKIGAKVEIAALDQQSATIEIARKLSLPLLATNCASYAQPQQRELLDVFTCIRHHRNLSNAGRLLTRNAERHLKRPEEMAQLFADLPEAIANTETLSSRLKFSLHDLGYEFPTYPVPDGGTEME